MKKGFSILMLGLCTLCIVSCSKTKSYTDYLNDEKKEVRRLISEKGFEILDSYPENGVFEENQFVELPSGVYLNVVDSGNGNRAVYSKTKILCRLSGEIFFNKDTATIFNLFPSGPDLPLLFSYGSAYATGSSDNSYSQYKYAFLSDGLESALAYVGNGSIVRMIVPFKMGSVYQRTYYEPLYFDRVKFTFDE